jgi:hypothetical protein
MTDIYKQHEAAFSNVSAFVVMKDGERVATVAIKFPRDGAGRLYAYVHVLGLPMVRGHATGYGYDKRSAAVSHAFANVACGKPSKLADIPESNRASYLAMCEAEGAKVKLFRELAPSLDGGHEWIHGLEKAGFTVLQAV